MYRRGLAAVAAIAVASGVCTVGPARGSGRTPFPLVDTYLPDAPFTVPLFNDPVSNPHLIRNVEFTAIQTWITSLSIGQRPGAIRASFYRFSDAEFARRLIYAARSGATVQVLLDGNNRRLGCDGRRPCTNHAFQILKGLNSMADPHDWLKTCRGLGPDHQTPSAGASDGCVGAARNHNKFMLIRSTGTLQSESVAGSPRMVKTHDIVIQTSSNNTSGSYTRSFNNALMTLNQPAVYADYLRYFRRLARSYDDDKAQPIGRFAANFGFTVDTSSVADHAIATWSFPRPVRQDPFLNVLDGVQTANHCANSVTAYGSPRRTQIGIAMSRVSGRLAVTHKLASVRRAGCDVSVVYASMSRQDHHILRSAGVRLRRLCLADPATPATPTEYVHSKYLVIAGTVGGYRDIRLTYTGSENLDDAALTKSDDRLEQYVEPAASSPIFDAYRANLGQLYATGGGSVQATTPCVGDE
jgi:hypothetical protein